jgi:hypothetical protein
MVNTVVDRALAAYTEVFRGLANPETLRSQLTLGRTTAIVHWQRVRMTPNADHLHVLDGPWRAAEDEAVRDLGWKLARRTGHQRSGQPGRIWLVVVHRCISPTVDLDMTSTPAAV